VENDEDELNSEFHGPATPVEASAQTSQSFCSSISLRSPWRIIAWSSAIRMRSMVDLQQPSSSAPCRETACGWHPLAARLHRTGPCTLELGRESSRGARRSGEAYRLVGILRVLIERIDVRPADDGSTIEFVGEIANMATLSALGR